MNHQDNLFKEFESVSAEAWLAKITVDLKGKDPNALNHEVGEHLILSPFHHADTMAKAVGPIVRASEGNEWLIGESFTLKENLKSTNQSILHALENGVQAIKITIDRALNARDLAALFNRIEPAYIHIHFKISESIDPIPVLSEFVEVLSTKKGDKNKFFGSIDVVETHYQKLEKWTTAHLPNFKTWCINGSLGDPIDQLTGMIREGVEGLTKSEDIAIADQMVFNVKIGTDFFLEIARLRALRIVWANVLKSYGLKPTIFPTITVEFDPGSQTDDPNQNMIKATTMAMSAAIGGADLLVVLPADPKEEDATGFYRRIARNVQHILKMESFLDRVSDIAGGSYYIETLTTKIGEAVWKNLSV